MENRKKTTLPPPPLKGQIERFKNHTLNRTDTFTLCSLNTILSSVGYTNNSITLDQTHMKYCLFGSYNGTDTEKVNHFTGEEFFTSLPSLLEHPVAIIPSNTMGAERQLIIIDYRLNDSYVCLSVRADGQGRKGDINFPSTHVFSICAKEKAEYILLKEIENEVEHQKYRNKPCGIYYIDNKKATEMLNSKGFQLPRAFNLNGLINTIQGQSLIVKKNETEKSQNHQIGGLAISKPQNLKFSETIKQTLMENSMEKSDLNSYLNNEVSNDLSESKLSEILFTSTIAQRLNDMGVRTYVIDNGKRRSLEWKVKQEKDSDLLLTVSDKKYYGFVYRDSIYLTMDGINPSVLLHEYAHLWLEVYRLSSSKQEWNNFKAEVISSPLFEKASKQYDSEVYATKDEKFTEFVCDYITHSALSGDELSSLFNDTINSTLTSVFEETQEIDLHGIPKLKNLAGLCIKDLIISKDLFKEFDKEKLDTLFALKDEYEISKKKEDEMRNGIKSKLTSYSDNKINETVASIKTLVKEAKEEHKTKVAKLAYKWVLDGSLILPEDTDKFKNAFNVAEKGHIDPFRYTSPVVLLEENTNVVLKEPPIDPDTVPTLSNKKVYGYGLVIYDVAESEESRKNMRRIINTHLGKNSSPWCILQGDDEGNLTPKSEYYWENYNGIKKQVAFIYGKLAFFRASTRGNAWWDTQDRQLDFIQIEQKIPYDVLERTGKYNYDLKTKKLSSTPSFIYKKTKTEYSEWEPSTDKKKLERIFQNGIKVSEKKWYAGVLKSLDTFNPITGALEEKRTYNISSKLLSYYKTDGSKYDYSIYYDKYYGTLARIKYVFRKATPDKFKEIQIDKEGYYEYIQRGEFVPETIIYYEDLKTNKYRTEHIKPADFGSSPIYYLSGPISNNPNAIHTFYQADGELLRRRMKTVNPFDIVHQIKGFDDLPPEEQWEVAMERDIEELKKADVLIALPRNGIESKGADIEERIARENGIPVVPYETLERNNFNIMKTLKELEETATTNEVISANTVLCASDFKQGHIALDEYALTNTIANLLEKVGIKTEVISSDKLLSFAENRIRQTTTDDTLVYKTLSTYEVYGYTNGKTIYLKEGAIKSDVLLHEYAHLWIEAFRLSNAAEWEKIKENLLKDPGIASSLYKYSPHLSPNTTDGRLVEYICDTIAQNGKNLTFDNILKSDLETLFKCESASETLKNISSLAIKDIVNSSPILKNVKIPENICFFDSKERSLFDNLSYETPSEKEENEKDSTLLEEKLKIDEYIYTPERDTILEGKLASEYSVVNVYDYTKVRADKLVLFSKRTILDKPYPSYLPPLKGTALINTIDDKFRIPAAPLGDGNLLIEDKYSTKDPITNKTGRKLDYYKVSLDVYASLKNYLITYFNALEEKRVEHNINEINKQLSELEEKYKNEEQFKDLNITPLYYEKTEGSTIGFYKTKITTANKTLPLLYDLRISADNLIALYSYSDFENYQNFKNIKDIQPHYANGHISLYQIYVHDNSLTYGINANERLVSPVHYTSRLKQRQMDIDTYNYIEKIGDKFTGERPTNPEIFGFWTKLQRDTSQRLLDMNVQEISILSSYAKGKETSYGEGGTKDTLYNDYGVLVKRQNGDEINTTEQKEINDVLSHVYSLYGDLSALAKGHSLKISHAGQLHQHASKAIGKWVPQYGTIGISFIAGDEMQAKSTGVHEFAHFLDRTKGEQTNHRYNSDIIGSKEQIIANEFRKKTHPSGEYWRSTTECFARCMELYASAHDFVKKHNYTIEQLKTPSDEREKYFDEFNKEYNYPQEDYGSRTGNSATIFCYINYDKDNPCLYELCSEYITSLRQEFHIEEFREKTTNFVISGNTETTTQATTTATVVETAETTPADTSMPSLLTLTNDEIHTLSECIKNKSDFVINNPNLDKPIHLAWGSMGDIRKTVHGIEGHGLEHFIQRRYESDKKNEEELTASILLIADAMKRATPTMHEESATKRNLIANGIKTIIDSVDKTKESNTELNHWKYISSMASEKYEAIKKEGKVAIQTVIAQYGFTQDFSEIRNQVGALITSIDRIREEYPIVNDLYEKKSKKVIFVLGNVFKSEEKERFEKEIEEIQRNAEQNEERIKVVNAYELTQSIDGISSMKFKQRNAVTFNKLSSELKKRNITEIVNISNSETTKVETEIEGYALRHGITYTQKYERVIRLSEGAQSQSDTAIKTTKSQNHQIGCFEEKTTNFEVPYDKNEEKRTEENMDEEKKESEVNDLTVGSKQAMSIRDKVKEVLNKEDNLMTREDRAILRQYEGVGGLKEEGATVEGALSEFYTPTVIVKKMWELMDAYNPDAYEVLEPSCGRGRFLDGRSDNHFTAYECDDVSSRIARILFPNADIIHDYYQSQFLSTSGRSKRKDIEETLEGYTLKSDDKNYRQYDAVIGNPPYGQIKDKFSAFNIYNGRAYHSSTYPDYFIRQGLSHLKAGGFLAFIVPSSLHDKIKRDVKELSEVCRSTNISTLLDTDRYSSLNVAFVNSRLVDAYRLPEGMFPSTQIGTDILIFKKESFKTWEYISYLTYEEKQKEGEHFLSNLKEAGEFFENHRDHILGITKTRINRHGDKEQYIDFADGESKEEVINRITPMKELIRERTREVIKGKYEVDKTTGEVEKEPKIVKPAKEPNWAKAQTGHTMSEAEFAIKYGIDKNFSPYDKEIWKATKYDGSIDAQKLSNEALSYLQNEKGKYIETKKDEYYLKALYTTGNIYTKLDNLEDKRKSGAIDITHYNECKKALTESIPEKIKMEDIHFSPLTQFAREFTVKREREIIERIGHNIGRTRSPYSGHYYDRIAYETVYKTYPVELNLKDAFIRWAINDNTGYAKRYNEAIANVKPEDLKTENNIIKWEHVVDYLNGVNVPDDIQNTDSQEVRKEKRARARSFKQDRRDVSERLFDKFLHCGLKEDEKTILVDKYNRTFNAVVEPDYTKLPVYVDGMHTHKRGDNKDKEFTMHPVQLRGASFLSAKGSGLLAYDVGVGKTTTGIVATVMQLQSGRAKRPLIIVPKAVYNKWWEDLHQHFPDIEVNDLGNLDDAHRVKFMNVNEHSLNIKEGTISLITYSGFTDHISFMDESLDTNGILAEDLKELLAIKTTGTNREKSLELQKLNSRYGSVIKTSDENYAFWEKTGFDHITVDEAHNFKKLFTLPRSERGESVEYSELSQTGTPSQRAMKLYAACQLVQAKNNDRNVFLLTATPFTNHPFEVFSMLAFMGRKRLKELQVNSIKAFADKFALTKSDWGVTSTGQIEFITSMKEWRNLKELQSVLHEYFDRVTAEEAGIKRPNKTVISPLLDITPLQKRINAECEEEIVGNSKNEETTGANKGKILTAINNMRKCILSPSLVNNQYAPPLSEFVNSSPKVKLCLDTIIKVYNKYPQGGQVVYCNLKDGFSVMKDYLIKNGISRNAIGIFEGGSGSSTGAMANKQKSIEDFNNPEKPLKIILGTSTIKEGVDLNGNSVALWNLTLDWNPSDITQVEGRAWRQGNKQSNVNIIYPLTYNSIDAFMYQKYDEKSSRINELFSYKGTSLTVEEINPMEMKYSLITDPDKRSKLIIDDKIKAIKMAISGYESEKEKYLTLINNLSCENDMIKEYEENKALYEACDKDTTDPEVKEKQYKLKNKNTEIKRSLDRLQKAKEHLKTYSIEEAQKCIDEINARIQAKKEEETDVQREKDKIIAQVKEEIAKTRKPTKTVEEYSEEIASQILAGANVSITSLHSEAEQNHKIGDLEVSSQNEEIQDDTQKSQNHQIGGFEEKTTNFEVHGDKNEEKPEEKYISRDEAIKRYGLSFNKKQLLMNKDQLFFAFLVARKDEIYSGNKEVGLALYNRLKDSGADIHIISERALDRLEKSLIKKYGDVMKGSAIYGYEQDGAIYISENRISANTILHEYTHLWTHSIMSANPLLWEKIKNSVMNTQKFRDMYSDPRYEDIKNDMDNLASETLSRICAENGVRQIEDRLSTFLAKDLSSEESIQYALSDTYGWVEENVFKGYKHTLNLDEISSRVLGDILKNKTEEKINVGYTFDSYIANKFSKERALKDGYNKLKEVMLEQFFSLRPDMSDKLKDKYREHYDSLADKSPKEACAILTRKIEENAVAYRFFSTVLDKNYPDETFQNHVKKCFRENSSELFHSAFETGMTLDTISGVLDRDRSNIYLHFVNFVARDFLKNDNQITKQLLSDFIAKEGKEALRMLYIISGDNMDYKMKIRSILPTVTYKDEKGQIHTKAETFGILDYDRNMLLSSEYNTTYVGKPTDNIQSDLTLEERAITLSDEFARSFGDINRFKELMTLRETGVSDEEINKIECKEKLYISEKNEVKRCAINAILEGYTIDTLYEHDEVNKELVRLREENERVFSVIREQEEEAMSNNKSYEEYDDKYITLDEFRQRMDKQANPSESSAERDKRLQENLSLLKQEDILTLMKEEMAAYKKQAEEVLALDKEIKEDKKKMQTTASSVQSWKERQEERLKEREKEKVQAAENAAKFYKWTKNAQIPSSVPYLAEHGLDSTVAKVNGVHYNSKYNSIQIPLYSNKTNELVNLQTIKCSRNENGKWEKYFLKGSDTNVHATLGEAKNPIVFVAEGWATSAAVQKATGELTYAAMSANNLKNTVEFVKRQHPYTFVVVIADNDRKIGAEEFVGIGEIKARESGADAVISIPTPGQDAADYALNHSLGQLIADEMLNNKNCRDFLHGIITKQTQAKEQKLVQTI